MEPENLKMVPMVHSVLGVFSSLEMPQPQYQEPYPNGHTYIHTYIFLLLQTKYTVVNKVT